MDQNRKRGTNKRLTRFLAFLAMVAVVITIAFIALQPSDDDTREPQQADEQQVAESTPAEKASDKTTTSATPIESIPTLSNLANGLAGMQPEQIALILNTWWTDIADSGMSNEEVSRMLVEYLDSGRDLQTGLRFKVGPNGKLSAAPTLRVQALDWLGEIDPHFAADYSRHIFETSTAPDEWALALRNYGRILEQPSEDAYFTKQVRALLNNKDWQSNPTRGFMEAFDSAVYSAAPDVIEDLLEVCFTSNHKGTVLAATMALDNIAGDDPLAVARIITQPNSLIEYTPTFRASLMSRLDPLNQEHTVVLENYFLNPAYSPEEMDVFIHSFPNHNDFASHYLLTRQAPRNLYAMAQKDLAALTLVQQWKADPAFANHVDSLLMMEERLGEFVQSAINGGFLKKEGD